MDTREGTKINRILGVMAKGKSDPRHRSKDLGNKVWALGKRGETRVFMSGAKQPSLPCFVYLCQSKDTTGVITFHHHKHLPLSAFDDNWAFHSPLPCGIQLPSPSSSSSSSSSQAIPILTWCRIANGSLFSFFIIRSFLAQSKKVKRRLVSNNTPSSSTHYHPSGAHSSERRP